MLNIDSLTVRYGSTDSIDALNGVSFSVRESEKVALIGANGAGKSTLLMSVVGVIKPLSGSISLDGVTVEKENHGDIRRNAGMVFQHPDDQLFMPVVRDDIAFGPRNYKLPEDEIKSRMDKILAELGIPHLKDRMTHKLSGGEKRLVALAGVLVMRPSLLLADEPTSFLDPKARRRLMQILKGLPQAMLIATHDLDMAQDICGRTILLKNGRVMADAPSGELLRDKKLLEDCGLELPLSLSR